MALNMPYKKLKLMDYQKKKKRRDIFLKRIKKESKKNKLKLSEY